MNNKVKALQVNKTRYLTDLPYGKTPIGCKWIYKVKYNVDGSIEGNKTTIAKNTFYIGYRRDFTLDFSLM